MGSRSRSGQEQRVSIGTMGSRAGSSLPEDHTAAARAVPAGEQNVHEGIGTFKETKNLELLRSWPGSSPRAEEL